MEISLAIVVILTLVAGFAINFLVDFESKPKQKKLNLAAYMLFLKRLTRKDIFFAGIFAILAVILTTFFAFRVLIDPAIELMVTKGIVILLALILILTLLALAKFDLAQYAIPADLAHTLVGAIVLLDLLLMIIDGPKASYTLYMYTSFKPFGSLLAGLGAGLFIWSIVFLTKEKGMGSGDIRLAAIMGLILGLDKIIIGFYITILSASLVGLLLAISKRRLKGVRLPFVPFMAGGTLLTLVFWPEILSALLRLLPGLFSI